MDRRVVLIVDDDAGVRDLLEQVFRRRGYECEVAGSGGEALEQFRASRPVLTVSDVRMPGMDGLAFLKAARALDPTAAIIMLTGAGDVQTGVECMKEGAADYLLKPVNPDHLLEAAERALERRQLLLFDRHQQEEIERQAAQVARDLSYLAQYDSLTGLANRTLFRDRLDRARLRGDRSGQPLALLLLDVDHFKAINESLGHDAGDLFLTAAAERLRQCVREVDSLARLGADEFAIVLEGLPRAEAAAVAAERVVTGFATPFLVAGREVFVTVSAGIAVYPADGADATTLVKNADAALSGAKEQGGNTYRFYTPDMNARALERLALQADLRRAPDRGELVLYYQPQVELPTGRVTGVEALLRWQHPARGLVPPGDFIPLAEESGLIIPIGEWALRAACEQARAWQVAGLGRLRVAVNLSARQFRHADLRQSVAQVLAETRLDPGTLELELTEGLLMDQTEAVATTLADLKAMGLLIAIDDFGTGYSSLSYLKRFAIDILKVDRSFVRDLTTDPDAVAIVRAIIALARSLRLSVVAEGVETREQLDLLRSLGCDEGQGYLFSRPVPADAFARWLAERS